MFSSLQNPRQAAAQLMNFGLILSTAFMVRPLLWSFLAIAPRAARLLACSGLTLGLQMWKGLSIVSDSPSPIVVVLSGSMEPAFQRCDLLMLWNRNLFSETNVGEIVVYNVKGKDIPIVHRVVRKFGTGFVFPLGVWQAGRTGADMSLQTGCQAAHQGRQQRGRRHRALCPRARLPEQERHCRVRRYPGWEPLPRVSLKLTVAHRSVVGYMPFVGYVTIMLSEHPWLKTVMLGIMGLVVVLQRE